MDNSDAPITPLHPEYGINDMPYRGLTKREHFAGLAMQGLIAARFCDLEEDQICDAALDYADALLKELSK